MEHRDPDRIPLQSEERERQDAALPSERKVGDDPGGIRKPQGMLPARERRGTGIERGFMRLVATAGIVGIAVALGAILVSQDVAGWIVGLVIGLTSVVLAGLLWSSRQL